MKEKLIGFKLKKHIHQIDNYKVGYSEILGRDITEIMRSGNMLVIYLGDQYSKAIIPIEDVQELIYGIEEDAVKGICYEG